MKLLEAIFDSNLIKNVFGFSLKENPKKKLLSVDINHEDGALEVISTQGGIIGFTSDFFQLPASEIELIKTYRTISLTSDVDLALTEIRNEILTFDIPSKKAIDLSINDDLDFKISSSLQQKIKNEYDKIYYLLDFQKKGLEIFDRWYIDRKIIFS